MVNRIQHALEPANSIVNVLGGPAKVADVLKVNKSIVYRFMTPRELGGRGGTIPHWYHGDLIAYARTLGFDLVEYAAARGYAMRADPTPEDAAGQLPGDVLPEPVAPNPAQCVPLAMAS